MKPYRDFECLLRDRPWTENGLHVTYVRDATPTAVIESTAVRYLGEFLGLHGINDIEWEEFSIVGAAALGNWKITIAPMAWAGSDADLMMPLSVGRESTHTLARRRSRILVRPVAERSSYREGRPPLQFRGRAEPDVGGVAVADERGRARPQRWRTVDYRKPRIRERGGDGPLSELEVASDATLMHVQQRDSADGRV